MKVSLITATFNSSNNLKSCLQSVIKQSHEEIEHIIIDGVSNDNTLQIIKNFQEINPKIKFISENDNGIYDALNKGIKMASGDIIGFIHSDDFLKSKDIISGIVSLISNEKFDGIYGDLQYVDKNNPKKVVRNWKSSEFFQKLLKKGWMPPHPTFFLRKEVYKKHGLFDLKYSISADYDFMLRVLKDSNLKFKYYPRVITVMRTGGISNSGMINIIRKTLEDFRIIKNNDIGNVSTLFFKNISKIKQFF